MRRMMRQPAGRALHWCDDTLEYWLGYAGPPAALAVRVAEFAPDDRNAYCHRCGDSVGSGEVTSTGCASCRDSKPIADAVIRLGSYVDALRDWILAIKYERWSSMAEHLGRMLGGKVRDVSLFDPADAVVVPMPMPWQRRIYRGIDHAHVLAAAVAQEIDAPIARILTKTHGPPQVTRSPSDRIKHGGRNLRVRKRLGGWKLHGCHVILVDDVRTTGTTLRRAARLIQQLSSPPESVTAAVLAVADSASRRQRSDRGVAID